MLKDFHMAHEERFWTTSDGKYAYITTRYYLCDALFLVGLEGPQSLLTEVEYALHHPIFPLFLGRRSCPPEGRISLGIREGKSLAEALRQEPWLDPDWRHKGSEVRLRIAMDASDEDTAVYFQRDVPLSFDQTHRQFGFRRVAEAGSIVLSPRAEQPAVETATAHDPMKELEEESPCTFPE